MSLTPLLVVLLSAAPAAPMKLAMPGLRFVDIEERRAEFLSEHVAQQLKLSGVEVTTQREISALLGMERQKQLLGCSEDSSCIAEIASAMGVDGVVLGDLARIGKHTQINLKIVAPETGKTLSLFSEQVDGEDALLEALTRGAQQLALGAKVATGRELPPPPPAPAGAALTRLWWIPVILGAASIVVGGIFFGQAADAAEQFRTPRAIPWTVDETEQLRLYGWERQDLGAVLVSVGGGLVGLGAALGIVHLVRTPAVTVTGSVSTGGVVFSGTFE